MDREKFVDSVFRVLAVISFVSMCWVLSRTTDERPQCLHSEFVAELNTSGGGLPNCHWESRLKIKGLFNSPSRETLDLARRLEALDALAPIWPKPVPMVSIQIDESEPFLFEMVPGKIRVGAALAQSEGQFERAIILGLLNSHFLPMFRTSFENEVTADFLLVNVLGIRNLQDPSTGDRISFDKDVSFAFTDRSINGYCNSSWKSLSHFMICSIQSPGLKAHDVSSWGTRPLVAKVLSDVYDQLGIADKVLLMRGIFDQSTIPRARALEDASSVSLALWMVEQSKAFLNGWGLSMENRENNFAFQRALMLARVFNVTQWDYTVEIANSPRWEQVWLSLRQWSQLHKSLHILVWSPIGIHAFPEGTSVRWGKDDVKTQKHLLVACKWPKANETAAIEARHFVALQVCPDKEAPRWSEVLTPTAEKVSAR